MTQGNSFRNGFILFLALCVAIWLGVSVVTSQTETIIKIAAAILLITCVFLGRKIWLLLIFFVALNFPIIRGFGTVEIGQCLFLGFTFLITLMRRQPFNVKLGELEIWMFLLAVCIVQVYVRNPVGLNLFGAGNVGAKPYFVVVMAFVTGIVLGNIVVKPEEIKWAMRLTIIGMIVGLGLTTLRERAIGVSGGMNVAANATLGDAQASGRVGAFGVISNLISRIVCSYISPLRGMRHPFWAILIIVSVAAAAGSGYRSYVGYVGLVYLVGMAYRGGFISVLIASVSSVMLLGALALLNLASPLPPNVQRALSPLPGTWEERHVKAADDSTEFRVEMWKEALFTDQWIQNKILGDGLGFTRRELLMMMDISSGGINLDDRGSGMSRQQEAMMVTGNYHSGPVQTVRAVGYAGLIVLVVAMIRIAVHAHQQILRCRGTEWYPLALFFGIPIIVLPIFFTFIFGEFSRDVAATFFAYGIVRLLQKNLPLPAYVPPTHIPYMLRNKNLSDPLETGSIR